MDASRFDTISRSLAVPGSRRRLLAGLAASVLGMAGAVGADARTCTALGGVCREHANCCTKRCGDKDRTGHRRCVCQAAGDCPVPAICHGVACRDGACVVSVLPDGAPCPASADLPGWCQAAVCVPRTCPDAVLSGGSSPSQFLDVDDDLEVLVNGVSVFDDNDENAGQLPPIELGALVNGDVVRVVASDTTIPQFCGGGEVLHPVYLHCPSFGTSQVINPSTIGGSGDECGHVFFDKQITVAL